MSTTYRRLGVAPAPSDSGAECRGRRAADQPDQTGTGAAGAVGSDERGGGQRVLGEANEPGRVGDGFSGVRASVRVGNGVVP
jgi:hypothetical protein